ncbi:bone morphogenetic protein 15 [Pelodiscus sinensis]|uniref:bone morphogenetic protein 15 n=1 Tax=Pelodiscus sinensis TaxID=13735 RepID=UPI003F6BD12E
MGPLCSLASLLLLALLPLALSGGAGSTEPAALSVLAGVPALPLLQELLGQVPSAWPGRPQTQPGSSQPLHYMLDLYRGLADRAGRPRRHRTLGTSALRLLRPCASTRQPGAGPWHVRTLDYRLTVQPEMEQLVRATVVYPAALPLALARLECVVRLQGEGRLSGRAPPPTGHRKPPATSGMASWAEQDVTPHLLPWAWDSQESRLLRVRLVCVRLGPAASSAGWEEAASLHEPFLLLYLNATGPGLRAKRDSAGAQETRRGPVPRRRARQAGSPVPEFPGYVPPSSAETEVCALRSFRVRFAQLGWDRWIIAPHQYNPKYCKGACLRILRYGYHAPNHAVVQNFVSQLVDQRVPRPSCVPYKYSPISVLMLEPGGSILYKEYEDMVAESCTCR